MILEMDFLLHSIGIAGVLIFYITLAKLSQRMGEGLRLPPYYRLYYVACFITLLTIPLHIYLHQNYGLGLYDSLDLQGIYVFMLLLSNVIVILVSIKYWGWLKDEILVKN